MIEMEDFGTILGFIGTLMCSYFSFRNRSKHLGNLTYLINKSNAKWQVKFLRLILLEYTYEKNYHVVIGLFIIFIGMVIILMY